MRMTRFSWLWFLTLVFAGTAGIAQTARSNDASLQLLQAEEDALQAAADRVQDSVVQVETFGGLQVVDKTAIADGPSTGTIVGADGWIVTSLFQFRNDPASITVVLSDGVRKAAKLVARDYSREVGLLKIEADSPLPIAVAAPRQSMQTGQWTIALGKTFDPKMASRSVGILSATRRVWDKAIQTDAKISPFNYGGPLINLQGQTLGILAPIDPGIATEGEVQQWYDSGVGFAIPLEDILARLPTLQKGTDIHRGLLGFRPATRDDFGTTIEVAGVIPGTPLAKAGFKKGDLIKSINGQPIAYVNQMRHVLGPIDAGQGVSIAVQRDGQLLNKDCTLVEVLPVYSNPFFGVLLNQAARNEESEDKIRPLTITAVEADSPADEAGLKAGESLLKYNGETLNSIEQFETLLTFSDYRSTVEVEVETSAKADEESELRTVRVKLQQWPAASELSVPALAEDRDSKTDKNAVTTEQRASGIVDLPLADIANEAFAFVPVGAVAQPLGLFLVAAEAGVAVDRKKIVDAWQPFAREQQTIVCVVTSASPDAWSIDELEVFDRVLANLSEQYSLDPRRTSVGGFGSGGTIALIEAFENTEKFRAIYFGSDRPPQRARLPGAEPQLAIDLLFGEINSQVESLQKAAQTKGYRAEALGAVCQIDQAADEPAAKALREFLATLAWY